MQPMIEYLLLNNNDDLPEISHLKPFRVVVVIESEVSSDWQYQVSLWLVKSGCLYMSAWGKECSSWDDSVDFANIEDWNYEDIPDESFVFTTWHEDEELKEVFWFAKTLAFHGTVYIANTLILHIANESKEQEFKKLYRVA